MLVASIWKTSGADDRHRRSDAMDTIPQDTPAKQHIDELAWYTYIYTYPNDYMKDGVNLTDIVFYVGKGTRDRINQHEAEARKGCKCSKCKVMREIWFNGYSPKKRIVHEGLSRSEALKDETKLIGQYAGKYLTNKNLNPAYTIARIARLERKE
jgi:hypothetical protein